MTSKEEYLRKMIEIGCNLENTDSIVLFSDSDLDNVRDVLLKLKDEYQLKQLILIENDFKKLYEFFKTNPSRSEIIDSVPWLPKLINPKRTKFIYNYQEDHEGYDSKIDDEFPIDRKIRDSHLANTYSDIFDLPYTKGQYMIVSFPNATWAKHNLGSKDKENELWDLVNRTIPDIKEYNNFLNRMKERRSYLQKSSIKNLRFYTSLGTDFKVSIGSKSLWLSEPENINNKDYFYNFPSYEVFTAPDCFTGEGKIVLSKPCMHYGEKITKGEFEFVKGTCIKCDTDCEKLNCAVAEKTNNIHRIGEIALVSSDSPIAQTNHIFGSLLYDENSGCHFALGHVIDESINIPDSLLRKNGKEYYHYNDSKEHHDLVFGDKSITVEADTGSNKILLLENGIWKI